MVEGWGVDGVGVGGQGGGLGWSGGDPPNSSPKTAMRKRIILFLSIVFARLHFCSFVVAISSPIVGVLFPSCFP